MDTNNLPNPQETSLSCDELIKITKSFKEKSLEDDKALIKGLIKSGFKVLLAQYDTGSSPIVVFPQRFARAFEELERGT